MTTQAVLADLYRITVEASLSDAALEQIGVLITTLENEATTEAKCGIWFSGVGR